MKNKFISCRKLFPELADETNRERFIDWLVEDDLKKFTKLALNKADYKLTDKDLQLCEIICDTLIRKKALFTDQRNVSTDVIIIAAMLRNTYKDELNPVVSIFMPRQEFEELLIHESYNYNIPDQFFEQLCQLIEAQEGDNTKVDFCKPGVGSIQQLFADCIYIQECIDRYGN